MFACDAFVCRRTPTLQTVHVTHYTRAVGLVHVVVSGAVGHTYATLAVVDTLVTVRYARSGTFATLWVTLYTRLQRRPAFL